MAPRRQPSGYACSLLACGSTQSSCLTRNAQYWGVGSCVGLTSSHVLGQQRLTVGTFEIQTWLGPQGLWVLEPCTGSPGQLWLPALHRAAKHQFPAPEPLCPPLLTLSFLCAGGLLPYCLADHNLIPQTAASRSQSSHLRSVAAHSLPPPTRSSLPPSPPLQRQAAGWIGKVISPLRFQPPPSLAPHHWYPAAPCNWFNLFDQTTFCYCR